MINQNKLGFISLHPNDNVAVALKQLTSHDVIKNIKVKGLIPAGHKISLSTIHPNEPVRKYNQIIGVANTLIKQGEHVHLHNLSMKKFDNDYEFSTDLKKLRTNSEEKFFAGIKRSNGQIATRNYIGILPTVNCSVTVAQGIANFFSRTNPDSPLNNYPNIDGVVALSHSLGCGTSDNGYGLNILQRTLGGYAGHPNFFSTLIVGLGCEVNQVTSLMKTNNLKPTLNLQYMNIQDFGGTTASILRGIEIVKSFLESANDIEREPCLLKNLVVGLQCGGSDSFSGITANPSLGNAVDRLVSYGATAILSETPEVYGAEHLLTRRSINSEVGQKLVNFIKWWENYVSRNDGQMNNNPSPGNKLGGLTTILEKSLGAIAKGGTSNLNAVYDYAEKIEQSGLVFMNTPGYDPVSATGQVAGGANLICFTTGRGSAYGCAPSPSIKISTNNELWRKQRDDLDINCGEIISGDFSVEDLGKNIFEKIISVASGEKTKSELHGYGQNEFVPWHLGAIM